jgi:hypothetical protein
MKTLISFCLLTVIASSGLAGTHVTQIRAFPENPEPMQPFHVYVVVELPDRCWSQGDVGNLAFTDLDSYVIGTSCSPAIFLYDIAFEHEGLPVGVHTVTVTEFHSSSRDPGTWEHPLVVVVDDGVADEAPTWSALKTLYR